MALFSLQGIANFALLGMKPFGVDPMPQEFPFIAAIVGLVGIPFVSILPTLKARGMARYWGVPAATLLLSRPLARFICSGVVGGAIGAVLALPFVDLRFLPLALSNVLMAIAITVATQKRFGQHSCTEWTMPPPGYKMVLPLIRGTRPNA